MAHTPGPWRLKESPHKREFSYFVDAGPELGSYFIAAINNGTGPDEANARLIAAAPELLKALEHCQSLFTEGNSHLFPHLAPGNMMHLHAEVCRAIQKARGQ